METYILTLISDKGKHTIKTAARSENAAIENVMAAESCPRRAIVGVRNPKFKNADGSLTYYSLKCGYIQHMKMAAQWKELYAEHGHFHVRMGNTNDRFQVWETFTNMELTKARKLYRSIRLK